MSDVKYEFYKPGVGSDVKYRFYKVDIDTPLSLAHNTPEFKRSVIGRLNKESDDQIFISEIEGRNLKAKYVWRVVDAYYTGEDSLITYFRAYGLRGESLPAAAFGVHYDNMPHRIGGIFVFKPQFRSSYYVPVENKFPTPNTGGYSVQVLSLDYPSEMLNFGMNVRGKQHRNLVISFRLFEMGLGYPNDLVTPTGDE